MPLLINTSNLRLLRQRFKSPVRPEIVLRSSGRRNDPINRILIPVDGSMIGYQSGLSRMAAAMLLASNTPWALGVTIIDALDRQMQFNEANLEWDPSSTELILPDLETLAQLPSRRDKTLLYTVKRNPENGKISCDCPGWINSRRDPRSCRHTLVFEALMGDVDIRPGAAVLTGTNDFKKLSPEEVKARNDAENTPSTPDPEVSAATPGFVQWQIVQLVSTLNLGVLISFSASGRRARVRMLTGDNMGGEELVLLDRLVQQEPQPEPYPVGISRIAQAQGGPSTITILEVDHTKTDKRAYRLRFEIDGSDAWFPVEFLKGSIYTAPVAPAPPKPRRIKMKRMQAAPPETPTEEPKRLILRAITFEDD